MADRIIIRTRNTQATSLDSPTSGIAQVKFRINPASVSIDQGALSSLKKARFGFVRTYFGEGLFNLGFSGVVNIHPSSRDLILQDPTAPLSRELEEAVAQGKGMTYNQVQNSSGWRWFQSFANFVRAYQSDLFELHYFGTPLMLSQKNPIFVGECSPVKYTQSSESPFALSYSFNFNGILLSDETDSAYARETVETLKVSL